MKKKAKKAKKPSTAVYSISQCRQLGRKCRENGQYEKAEIYYQKWIEQNPVDAEAYNLLGNTYREQWKLEEATKCYKQALAIHPHYAAVFNNLGATVLEQGETKQALEYYQAALRLEPNFLHYQSFLLGLHYPSGLSAKYIFQSHLTLEKYLPPTKKNNSKASIQVDNSEKIIRIGYVSGDFRDHSVNYFFEPILREHNRKQFHITCYSNNSYEDSATKRLKRLAHQWVDCTTLTDKALCSRIKRDQIDILVDLSGLTPFHRLGVFAQKPAPIQITGIGYVHTTGLASIDYRLVDQHTDPVSYANDNMVEQPLYLPYSYCCYDPLTTLPEQSPSPALQSNTITFASFGKLSKISTATFDTWCVILQKIPHAQLHLYNHSFQDESTCDKWLQRFMDKGISEQQIKLGYLESTNKVLTTYQYIDIVLDTFPYNGCTTTCQALTVGVPVVSLWGETHAARVGGSFLTTVGLSELIADSPEQYSELCVHLAQDLVALDQLRSTVRKKMLSSPLMDVATYTHHLEELYTKVHHTSFI